MFEDWDNHRVVDLLREFSPRDPNKGVRLFAQLRQRTQRLLIRPEVLEEVVRAADLMLEEGEVNGRSFYQVLYGGRCGARHRSLTEVGCQKDYTWSLAGI